VKSLFGESLGASGAVQTAAAALSIRDSLWPGQGAGRLREGRGRRVERVLVNSFSTAGHKSSLVLRKVGDADPVLRVDDE
jgi:3-oxoacyl-(acyl-carrier-protein) synthase